jgi:hypothetical protein
MEQYLRNESTTKNKVLDRNSVQAQLASHEGMISLREPHKGVISRKGTMLEVKSWVFRILRPPSRPSPKMGEGEWRVGLEGEAIKSYQHIPLWAQIRTSPFMGEAGGGDCPRRHRPSRDRARRVTPPDAKRTWTSTANWMLSILDKVFNKEM